MRLEELLSHTNCAVFHILCYTNGSGQKIEVYLFVGDSESDYGICVDVQTKKIIYRAEGYLTSIQKQIEYILKTIDMEKDISIYDYEFGRMYADELLDIDNEKTSDLYNKIIVSLHEY